MTARVIVVASHRRSGTHLLLDTLRANVRDVHGRFTTLERIEPGHHEHVPLERFQQRLERTSGIILVKTHALPSADAWSTPDTREYAANLLRTAPTIYVHRDGRDVMASLYHYTRSYSERVAAMSFGEFVRTAHTAGHGNGLNRAAYWQRHVTDWLDAAPTARVSFEQLRSDHAGALAAIAGAVPEELQLRPTLEPVVLDPHARRGPALRILQRALPTVFRRRSTAIRPWSGASGGWRATFGDGDLEWFVQQAGEAMRRLGYEAADEGSAEEAAG